MMPIRVGKWGLVFVATLLWIAVCVPTFAQIDLVGDVRAQLAQNSFSAAEAELRAYKAQHEIGRASCRERV